MAVSTVNFDQRTEDALIELKEHFQASSKVEILRKAVILLKRVKDEGSRIESWRSFPKTARNGRAR